MGVPRSPVRRRPVVSSPDCLGGARQLCRQQGTTPYEGPGYAVPLTNFVLIEPPRTLAGIRSAQDRLRALLEQLGGRHPRAPLYFPFELSPRRPPQLLQGYALKLPLYRCTAVRHRVEA